MSINYYERDLPDDWSCSDTAVAVDTEAMGLKPYRDRLCVIQLSVGNGEADIIRIGRKSAEDDVQASNIVRLMLDTKITKIFHYARFDLGAIFLHFGVMPYPVWCTKIASKLVRTYTDKHSLKELLRGLLCVDVSKRQQHSDWGVPVLSKAQLSYAASDVLYLHQLKEQLTILLEREGRLDIAEACFEFLPTKVRLDLMGWNEESIFDH